MPPFWIFIAPIAMLFLFLLPLRAQNQPIIVAAALVSLAITVILSSLYYIYIGFKTDRYIEKHNFQLWKKSKSSSFRERREAGKTISSMRIPCLEKHIKYANIIAFILFLIWMLIFLGIFSFIVFSAMSGWSFRPYIELLNSEPHTSAIDKNGIKHLLEIWYGITMRLTVADWQLVIPSDQNQSSPQGGKIYGNRARYAWYFEVSTRILGYPKYKGRFPVIVKSRKTEFSR